MPVVLSLVKLTARAVWLRVSDGDRFRGWVRDCRALSRELDEARRSV